MAQSEKKALVSVMVQTDKAMTESLTKESAMTQSVTTQSVMAQSVMSHSVMNQSVMAESVLSYSLSTTAGGKGLRSPVAFRAREYNFATHPTGSPTVAHAMKAPAPPLP
jgi:hypothetical protein